MPKIEKRVVEKISEMIGDLNEEQACYALRYLLYYFELDEDKKAVDLINRAVGKVILR